MNRRRFLLASSAAVVAPALPAPAKAWVTAADPTQRPWHYASSAEILSDIEAMKQAILANSPPHMVAAFLPMRGPVVHANRRDLSRVWADGQELFPDQDGYYRTG